ncbi:hypothetical protein IMCC3317_21010 [Kordia antarctica]|uniref:Lipoprotein n=1 Tax=Kordia antarctica TaxID=1218801 RepID=A0A7L4ZJP1_9FLAO|nr:hypothetical protein [Kordia antarctica]QHI36731.1 hypothetical protein IMCC3317_21010 [Kordia antarctica]
MKIANNILVFIFFACMISCKQNHNYTSNVEISSDADSLRYRLRILDTYSDSIYKIDEKGKSEILIEKKLYVLDSCFGSPKDFMKLVNHVKKRDDILNKPNDVSLKTFIKIKNIKNLYEQIWVRSEPLFPSHDQLSGENKLIYGLPDTRVDLSEYSVNYNNRTADGIKISFHDTTSDQGYKIYMLNFVRHEDSWILVSRERLNTLKNDSNREPLGYCYDTINANCNTRFKKGEVIYIHNEMMYDLTNEKCY